MTGTRGLEFLLDLENAVALRGGDALVLDDGRLIEVVAAPEPLIEIRGSDPQHLVRVAWHLGNRHLPTADHGEGPAHPPRSRHRGDGEGARRPRDRDRGAVRSRRRRLCRRRPCAMRTAMATIIARPCAARSCIARSWSSPRSRSCTATTITTTSIAITTIITAIPMLMTTSKPPRTTADASRPATDRAVRTADEAAALYRLMTWLSPAFPVGAFSYSSGIEWAVEAGDIIDAASLAATGWRRCWPMAPAFATACSWRMRIAPPRSRDDARLARGRRTRRRLRAVARAPARNHDAGPRLHRDRARGLELRWRSMPLIAACDGAIVYPVAVGLVSAAHGDPAGRRPCTPSSTRVVVELDFRRRAAGPARADRQPARAGAAGAGRRRHRRSARCSASLDDLGSATFRADLASMRHETQYTRLFRS